jgi:hypothetical protein
MRRLASFLLVALAVPAMVAPAMAAETWRWKDERGVVHYSDTPVPGAERVTIAAPPPATGNSTPETSRAQPPAPPVPKFTYAECTVEAPGNDQVFNAVSTITAALQIQPSLLEDHGVRVMVDGKPYPEWPAHMLTFKIEKLNRGTHTLAAQIVDEQNKIVCDGPSVTFHVRQPSVLAPGRIKPKPKP